MRRSARLGRAAGFTLTELMVAMSVAAIAIGLAIPSFQTLFAKNRLAVTGNKVRAAALTARSMAVSKRQRITLCAGTAEEGCHGDWSRRTWLVFEDRNRDGAVDADETVHIAERDIATTDLRVSWNGPFAHRVVFTPSGGAVTRTGAFAAGRIRLCVDAGSGGEAVELVLIGSGRLESEHKTFDEGCAPL